MFESYFKIITEDFDPTKTPDHSLDLCKLRAIVHELLQRGFKPIKKPKWIKQKDETC